MTCVLTLGTFDGVHRGHTELLSHVVRRAGVHGTSIAIVFQTPPASFFLQKPIPLITTWEHRIALLQKTGLQKICALDFTQEIASLSYATFLEQLQHTTPFDLLILGDKAAFGKNKEGTADKIVAWGKENQVEILYIPKLPDISSRKIRTLIETGHLKEASELLGRPYSLLSPSVPTKKGVQLTFEESLCLPPTGTYPVLCEGKRGEAIIQNRHVTLFISLQKAQMVEVVFI